jgi:hypothetical protein
LEDKINAATKRKQRAITAGRAFFIVSVSVFVVVWFFDRLRQLLLRGASSAIDFVYPYLREVKLLPTKDDAAFNIY